MTHSGWFMRLGQNRKCPRGLKKLREKRGRGRGCVCVFNMVINVVMFGGGSQSGSNGGHKFTMAERLSPVGPGISVTAR